MNDIPAVLAGFLEDPLPVYQAELADSLVDDFWQALGRPFGGDRYTTAAWLSGGDSVSLDSRHSIVLKEERVSSLDLGYSKTLIDYLVELGLFPCPRCSDAMQIDSMVGRLRSAYDRLAQVPDAYRTVLTLASSIHALDQPDPEYDISHSSPNLPFSVFLTVPSLSVHASELRIAESLLHESLHLLLSLIERKVDLVRPECRQNKHYSPWRQAERPLGGVLHGVYVFRGIYDYLCSLDSDEMSLADVRHCRGRMQQIHKELVSLSGLFRADGLTDLGAAFLKALLDAPEAPTD